MFLISYECMTSETYFRALLKQTICLHTEQKLRQMVSADHDSQLFLL